MDILTHTLSGIAAGTVLVSFSRRGFAGKMAVVLLSAIGAAFPDIDAVSLWSKFDGTLGKALELEYSGHEIYFSKFWYSHHAFFHSLVAGLLFALLAMLALYAIRLLFYKQKSLIVFVNKHYLIVVAFLAGYLIHLFEDMPTPASVWGGVNFFWPSHSYTGGSGKIWWWNNYDIFLIILFCILINTVFLCVFRKSKLSKRLMVIGIGLFSFALTLFQFNNRPVDFNYTGHTSEFAEYEQKSKLIQRDVLGNKLYGLMEKFDNKLPIHF